RAKVGSIPRLRHTAPYKLGTWRRCAISVLDLRQPGHLVGIEVEPDALAAAHEFALRYGDNAATEPKKTARADVKHAAIAAGTGVDAANLADPGAVGGEHVEADKVLTGFGARSFGGMDRRGLR